MTSVTTEPKPLSEEQIAAYWRDGYAVLPDALLPAQLQALAADFAKWCDESRSHHQPYGRTMDDRPRFDVEPGHHADRPALRRIASPTEISVSYLDAIHNSPAVDAVAQLIGPNIEFNNSKINAKQPGATTEVRFHQDFMFQPHTNEDLVAVLFFLDEVTAENGPLQVVPGSHRQDLHSHWHQGIFTGTIDDEIARHCAQHSLSVVGQAGTACLMHTRLLHGSAANRSARPRTLFISEYRAEDSKPLQVNHIPSIHEGDLVRGQRTNHVRCSAYSMQYPEVPTGASFFSQQAKAGKNT